MIVSHRLRQVVLLAIVASLALPASLAAQDKLFIFPAKGQSAKQQATDEKACHDWAVLQVGFDPSRNAPPPAPDLNAVAAAARQQAGPPPAQASKEDTRKARRRGALRGAARGAVIGEVAGGKWEDGAMVGGAGGAMRGAQGQKQQAAGQQQAHQQSADANVQASVDAAVREHQGATARWNAKLADHQRAQGACLGAKGYNVK